MRIKTKLLIALLIIFIVLIMFFLANQALTNKKVIAINGNEIEVIIADTPKKQTQGLSGQKFLEANQGMLFIYPDYQIRSFWMKGMNFPLDIIWILDDEIIGIEKNILPPNQVPLESYRSPRPVNYVLEVNAGFSDKNNIKIGDKLKFNP